MSDIFERVLLLKNLPLFSGVDTEDLRVVAHALQEEMFFKGERMFDMHDNGDRMFVLTGGKVGISIHPDPSRQEFIVERGAGECIGEMGILDDQPRSATIHVLEDTLTLTLEKACLQELIIRYPALALGILRSMSAKLRDASARINS